MKYYIYRFEHGYKWRDDFKETADYFNQLPTDGKYTTIGITEDSYGCY